LASRDNCWVKVCGAERIASEGPPFTSAVPFAQAVIDVAPDRTLWGTDWPHPNIKKHMPNDGDLVDLIPLIAPTREGQQKLLVDNPHRLYGFRSVVATYSAAQWAADARAAIAAAHAARAIPIVVGGTGLYIRSRCDLNGWFCGS